MNDQERWNYLMGLRSDELELLVKDEKASKDLREGAQTLLDAKNRPVWYPVDEAGGSSPTPRAWAEHAEKLKSSQED